MSWNVKGVNNEEKRKVIKSFIKSHNADLVCARRRRWKLCLCLWSVWGWGALKASRAAGGVLLFWDKRVLELLEMEVGSYSISSKFKCCENNFVCFFWDLWGGGGRHFDTI